MARREELLELLRPPAHRGPLIAAGAVLFTAAIALEEIRLDDALPNGLHLIIVAASAALILGLGLQARLEGGSPEASGWSAGPFPLSGRESALDVEVVDRKVSRAADPCCAYRIGRSVGAPWIPRSRR